MSGKRKSRLAALAAILPVAAVGVVGVRWERQRWFQRQQPERGGGGDKVKVGLITKTETNPFFVKMKEGAQKAAKANGASCIDRGGQVRRRQRRPGHSDGEHGRRRRQGHPDHAERLQGDRARRSRRRVRPGVLVIALDTPTEPQDAADALFATDNFKAGELIGQWAKAKFARARRRRSPRSTSRRASPSACSATTASSKGFGATRRRDVDRRRAGHRAATRPRRQTRDGEPASRRTRTSTSSTRSTSRRRRAPTQALKAAGKEKDVTIVSVDGGCTGVQNVKDGMIARDVAAVPAEDGRRGRRGGRRRSPRTASQGRPGYTDTGVTLITDKPQDGVDVQGHRVRPGRTAGARPSWQSASQARPGARSGAGRRRPVEACTTGWPRRPHPRHPALATRRSGRCSSLLARDRRSSASRPTAFLHRRNLSLIVQQVMVVGTLAIGQTLIILTAGIDLSCRRGDGAVGSIVMAKMAADSALPGSSRIAARPRVCTRVRAR